MAGSIFNNINPGITSGTQLATLLNAFRDAMTSNSKGTSRPTNLLPGGVWVDDTNEGSPNFTVDVKLYDGSDDIKLMTINVNTNTVFIDSLASEEFEIVKVSDDAVGPQLILQKKRVAGSGQVLSNDILGLLNFKSIDNSGNIISEAASIEVSAQENHTNTNQGTRVKVNVRKAGQNTKTTQVTIDDEVTVAPRTTFQSVVNFQNGAEGTPLRGAVVAGTDILTPGTVSSVDISSLFSGKSESTSSTVKGVPTSSPYNKVMIRHALGTNQDDELKDSLGNQVYGRITKAGPVWTLSFYTKIGTTETAYTLTSGQSTDGIRWYYQELFNPLLDLPVYDPIFQVPSDNATADVIDASATHAGKVNTGSQTFAGEKTFENAMVFKQLGSAPTNPPSTYYKLYPKVDGFYYIDEAGLEKKVGSGGSSGVNFVTNGNAEDAAATIFSTYKLAEAVNFTDTGDIVTLNNHGLTGASQISFTSIVSTTGISTNTLYWPVGITTNTFQVSLTQGGAPIALTTNGSGTLVRSRPVTGTGGSPTNVSSSLSTSAPLAGAKEFTLFKAAANAQGEGWAIALDAISPAYRSRVLQIEFDYMVDSGTFIAGSNSTDGDVIVYLYDITNSTLIEPTSFKLLASSTSVSDKFQANFQTSATGSQYRMIFHVASVNTAAFQLKVDNISVSPIAGWSSSVQMSEQGGFRTVRVDGAGNGGTSVTADVTPITFNEVTDTTSSWNGSVFTAPEEGLYDVDGAVLYTVDSTSLQVRAYVNNSYYRAAANLGGVSGSNLKFNISIPLKAGETLDFRSNITRTLSNNANLHYVTITKRSSPNRIAANELVLAVATGNPASATSGNPFIFPTKIDDTHNQYNASTGRFTVPAAGRYEIIMPYAATGGANATIYGYKNGSQYGFAGVYNATLIGGIATIVIPCVAGDIIDIRPNNTVDISDGQISFKRLGF